MDSEEFRKFAGASVEFIIDYLENIRDRPVLSSVEPGYLHKLIPNEIPEKPDKWQDIIKDMENIILPGIVHWQSPQFLAYFPAGQSYPSIVGELLSAGLAVIGFNWATSPACTELEVAMMNWLGKLIDLPEEFLNSSEGPGGGIIQGSASEATLVGMLAAKQRTVRRIQEEDPTIDEATIKGKLVAYASNQSNSSVEKTGLLGSVPIRLLSVDKDCCLRGDTFLTAVKEDIEKGFIPCFLVATFGTTGTCAFDNVEELAEVCQKYNIWLHIDAAYAGAALICPEYRHLMKGIDKSDSFNFNLHKWLLVNFDCSAMWVKNANYLVDTFNVERIYLGENNDQNSMAPDYRHWQIPLGRRFRALKLWTTLRLYGVEGLQNSIRKYIRLAELFASHVRTDNRFEIIPEPSMALVCFRLKGDDELTKQLLQKLIERKKLFMVPATYEGLYIIRYVVCSRLTNETDIEFSWNEIRSQADEVLNSTLTHKNNNILQNEANQNMEIQHDKENFKISNTCHQKNITTEKYK